MKLNVGGHMETHFNKPSFDGMQPNYPTNKGTKAWNKHDFKKQLEFPIAPEFKQKTTKKSKSQKLFLEAHSKTSEVEKKEVPIKAKNLKRKRDDEYAEEHDAKRHKSEGKVDGLLGKLNELEELNQNLTQINDEDWEHAIFDTINANMNNIIKLEDAIDNDRSLNPMQLEAIKKRISTAADLITEIVSKTLSIKNEALESALTNLRLVDNTKENRGIVTQSLLTAVTINTKCNKLIESLNKIKPSLDLELAMACNYFCTFEKLVGKYTLLHNQMKEEKHALASQEILKLNNEMKVGEKAIELFRQGSDNIAPLKCFIQYESEHLPMIIAQQSVASHSYRQEDISEIANSLLENFDNTQIEFGKDDKDNPIFIFTLSSGKKIQLEKSEFDHINFENVSFTKEQLNKYCENVLSNKYLCFFQEDVKNKNPELHDAYKLAVNIYTGPGYTFINSAFRGLEINQYGEEKFHGDKSQAFKEGMLHGIMALNGMKQLPIVEEKTAFRVERAGFVQSGLEENLRLAFESGKGFIVNNGFLSTAQGNPDSNLLRSPHLSACVIIKKPKGINVAPFSQFPSENEILIPPGVLRVEGYKKIKVKNKELTFLILRPVDIDPAQIGNHAHVLNNTIVTTKKTASHEIPHEVNQQSPDLAATPSLLNKAWNIIDTIWYSG